jgi:hypothetical protein
MKDRLALKGKFVEFYYKSLLVYLYDECFRGDIISGDNKKTSLRDMMEIF